MRDSTGRGYFDVKIPEGGTRSEAIRRRKRRLANLLGRLVIVDERRLTLDPIYLLGPCLVIAAERPTRCFRRERLI